jgi:hypothetical protein
VDNIVVFIAFGQRFGASDQDKERKMVHIQSMNGSRKQKFYRSDLPLNYKTDGSRCGQKWLVMGKEGGSSINIFERKREKNLAT